MNYCSTVGSSMGCNAVPGLVGISIEGENENGNGGHPIRGVGSCHAPSRPCTGTSGGTNIDYDTAYSRMNWDPTIEVGKVFDTKQDLLRHLQITALRGHFETKVYKSDKSRVIVECLQKTCPWRVRASTFGENGFIITKYNGQHECDMRCLSDNHRQATAALVGECVKRKFEESRTIYTPHDIMKDIKHDLGVNINYVKAWRAREIALHSIRGSPEESYYLLPSYSYVLEQMNPGTKTHIHTDKNNHFLYYFMAIGACIRGFRSSMRPVIAVDATHLKCRYKGIMIVANAFDGNRNIYPVAFGIGDLETDACWLWFFSKLVAAIGECPNLVIVSDRNVSIENVLRKHFPNIEHVFCIYHMQQNIQSWCHLSKKEGYYLKYFESAAKSYGVAEFDAHYRKIMKHEKVLEYLEYTNFKSWSRAHMDGRRYNLMTTNIAESLNSVLRFARAVPVLQLIDEIVNLLVKWFSQRRDMAQACKTPLCPNFGESKLWKRLADAFADECI